MCVQGHAASAKRCVFTLRAAVFSPNDIYQLCAGLAFKWEGYRREAALEGRHSCCLRLSRDARRKANMAYFLRHGLRDLMAHIIIVVNGPSTTEIPSGLRQIQEHAAYHEEGQQCF